MAAQARKDMQEAKNLDMHGTKKVDGQIVEDRDGYEWTIQAAKRDKQGNVWYDVSPVIRPRLGDIGYVFRRLTDQQIDTRDFGFKSGHNLRMVDGELTRVPTQFT